MKPLFWSVLVEIKKAEEVTSGGIVLAEDVRDKENLLTMVGRVSAMGPMAFKTKTSGGHDYRLHHPDFTAESEPDAPKVGIGTWVLMSRKFGIPIKTKDGKIFQLCNDYEIIAVLDEDEATQIRGYV